MALWRKVTGVVIVIAGIIVILTSPIVLAGEEIIWTGFIVQSLIGAAMIVVGAVLLVFPRKRP